MSVATLLAAGLRLFSPLEHCKTIQVTVPSGGYVAGQIYKFEDVIGVSYATYAEGDAGVLIVEADDIEVTCVAAGGTDLAVGEHVYFDEADAEVNQSASGNLFCGYVMRQPAATEEKVRIRLFGGTYVTPLDVTPGLVEANRLLAADGNKDVGDFRNLDAVNIDAGSSGVAGTVDVFPATASKGKTALTAADNAGDTTTTITTAEQAGARTYTVPDAGASASFLMTEGDQALGEGKDLAVGSTTGTKIGTATAQKLGFWNATPVVQPAGATQAAPATYGTGAFGLDSDANMQALYDLVVAMRTALVNAGLIKGSA